MTTAYLPIIALVGRPNVGKSSLFNRLSKTDVAIVDATPGVTRDRHYSRIDLEGVFVLLVDTGGIEEMESRAGAKDGASTDLAVPMRDQTMQAMEDADIILCLFDAREGITALDREIVGYLRQSQKKVVYIANKIDGPEKEEIYLAQFYELGLAEITPLSSAHKYNMGNFKEELGRLAREYTRRQTETPGQQADAAIRIACIGRPNVGKSSLINQLAGTDRMVVSQVPGTTRDAVDIVIERKERTYLFIDTAGIRRRGKVNEKIEKFSVMKTLHALTRSEVALALIDAGEGITEQDTKVIGYALDQGRAVIVLVNKWDLLQKLPKQRKKLMDEIHRLIRFASYIPILPVSSLTGFATEKIFPLVDTLFRQYSAHFTTGQLNRILRRAVEGHSPPLKRGRRIKLFYVTQVGAAPPTFLIMTNDPKGIHFSYERYLINTFRKELRLDAVPVRLVFKERPRRG